VLERTHAILSGDAYEKKSQLSRLIVTDSIPLKGQTKKSVELCTSFAEGQWCTTTIPLVESL
jgi:phosphoribosylpyrophosphate synthetase